MRHSMNPLWSANHNRLTPVQNLTAYRPKTRSVARHWQRSDRAGLVMPERLAVGTPDSNCVVGWVKQLVRSLQVCGASGESKRGPAQLAVRPAIIRDQQLRQTNGYHASDCGYYIPHVSRASLVVDKQHISAR